MALQEKLLEVVKAALDGPAIEGISIKGHGFNVDRAKREVGSDGRIIVDGRGGGDNISHRRKASFDDQVDYGFTVQVTPTGVDITNMSVSIAAGGLLNTWGAPIVAAIKLWDEIECLWDALDENADSDFSDCDPIELIKALYEAVKQDSSEVDVGEVDLNIDQLENERMSWREVAELMILTIASSVVISAIARERPDWASDKSRIMNVAPDFAGGDFSVEVPKAPPLPGSPPEQAPGGLTASQPAGDGSGSSLPGFIGAGAQQALQDND